MRDWSWNLVTLFSCLLWLAVADTLRTAYMDYDEYKVNSIKELLVAV
jgi:hypothetical protein